MKALKAPVALALVAVLLAGCGGGSTEGVKVEAGLRNYLSTIDPAACLGSNFCDQGVFPLGAGVPQVKKNSCKKMDTGPLRQPRLPKGYPRPPKLPEGLTAWSCVITFAHGKSAMPVHVAAKRSGDVYTAGPTSQAAPLPPATTYEGGP